MDSCRGRLQLHGISQCLDLKHQCTVRRFGGFQFISSQRSLGLDSSWGLGVKLSSHKMVSMILADHYDPALLCNYCNFPFAVNTLTICAYEDVNLECPRDSSIVIKEAEYGHIGISKCIELDLGHFGCKADVTSFLDEKCAGKRICNIADDDELRSMNPCHKGLEVFLQMSYICVSGW